MGRQGDLDSGLPLTINHQHFPPIQGEGSKKALFRLKVYHMRLLGIQTTGLYDLVGVG